jgi:CheY-like chemotaxis protein
LPSSDNLIVMTGGFAHDLNNLLTGILGSVALARAALAEGESAEPHLGHIETAALCAGDLCRQVLAQAGRSLLRRERVHLSQLVAQTLPLLHLTLGGRARLKLRLIDDLPLVLADSTQLRQVLINLVTNGAEAIAAGGRSEGELRISTRQVELDADSLRGTYTAPAAAPGPHVALVVRDNGTGIDPAVLPRIFEPFFTTKPGGGTAEHGLGLSVVLAVVRSMKGVLHVRTSREQGTEFELLLPCLPVAPAATPQVEVTTLSRSVLVVDDDAAVREYITRVLRTAGYHVVSAASEEETLALFAADEPAPELALALVDWALGGRDGEGVVRGLRGRLPELPIVILSGYGSSHYEGRLRDLSVAGTLQKPFRFEALLSLVHRLASLGAADPDK